MKTDFSINVQVNLGVTPEIMTLVSAILRRRPTAAQSNEALLANHDQVDNKAEAEPTKEPAGAATPNEGKVPTTPKDLTEEDVRAAMHRTRQRIEGENYKENTDSDAYKKYHKALNAEFKKIAAFLGADKPSALPAEQRANFIAQCDDLKIMEDGTIGTELPF